MIIEVTDLYKPDSDNFSFRIISKSNKSTINFFTELELSFFPVMFQEHPLSITNIPFFYIFQVCSYKIKNLIFFRCPSVLGSLRVSGNFFGSPNSYSMRLWSIVIWCLNLHSTSIENRFIVRKKRFCRWERVRTRFMFILKIIRSDLVIFWCYKLHLKFINLFLKKVKFYLACL